MLTVSFITGNGYKFEVTPKALENSGINIIQNSLDTPEIQSDEVFEIASFSARWATDYLSTPVVVTNVGYYIKSLNGFSGPLVERTNRWLSSVDYLRLLDGITDRSVETRECLAFCQPGTKPVCFTNSYFGTLDVKIDPKGSSPIDEIFVPDGFNRVETAIPHQTMVRYRSEKSPK